MKYRKCDCHKPNMIGDKGLYLCKEKYRENCTTHEIKYEIYYEMHIKNAQNFLKEQIQVTFVEIMRFE